ncbi:MAG: hypothetical protein JWL92_264 [Candidatus Nomurabacteria bacterium]|nr:hypothetical protein [Candidatus Nomurabacteria bacterium]
MKLKSQYDIIIEQFERGGKVHVFTDKENMQIHRELNTGLDEFNRTCINNQIDSERELSTIVLNA